MYTEFSSQTYIMYGMLLGIILGFMFSFFVHRFSLNQGTRDLIKENLKLKNQIKLIIKENQNDFNKL